MKYKFLIFAGVIGILAGCRSASVEKDALLVSTPYSSFNSDIICAKDAEVYFTYDLLPISFYFDFPDTIGGFNPKCIIDSIVITFYNEKDGKIRFTHYQTGHVIDSLHFEINVTLPPKRWTEAEIDLVPSWLKASYKPIYDMHQGNPSSSPQPLKARAHYKVFAHELNTRRLFITEFDITVVFANFADE